jgi:hypothetical protein
MTPRDSALGDAHHFSWTSYRVSPAQKSPLLRFISEALEMRGCRLVYVSEAKRAPFFIVFDLPSGERQAILAYAFFANAKATKNRPVDEHRFQVKLGSDLTGVLDVAIDQTGLVTTIFLGIDPERGVFVAADPAMNTPAPMSRSIEFKEHYIECVLADGWFVWERVRHPPKTKHRRAFEFNNDARIEILVGGRKERLLDLIALERVAAGLDPGERHLVADKLAIAPALPPTASHHLLTELAIDEEQLLDLIAGTGRLKMAVRGWVAEVHLESQLKEIVGVTDCHRIAGEGKPDISLRWKGSPPFTIECKNSLRATYSDGRPKVDFQRTRASKADPCSRYYKPSDFGILAVCLHAVCERWEFRYALTAELPPHEACVDRIANIIAISEPLFLGQAEDAFDRYLLSF